MIKDQNYWQNCSQQTFRQGLCPQITNSQIITMISAHNTMQKGDSVQQTVCKALVDYWSKYTTGIHHHEKIMILSNWLWHFYMWNTIVVGWMGNRSGRNFETACKDFDRNRNRKWKRARSWLKNELSRVWRLRARVGELGYHLELKTRHKF